MKKGKIIVASVIGVVLVVGILVACLLKSRDDSMASSIPQNVQLVGRVDVKSLVLDYGLSMSDFQKLLSGGQDSERTGIKFQTAAYVFGHQGLFGAIIPLSDDDDFEEYLKKNEIEVSEQRDLKWCTVDNSFLMGFSDDRAIVMGPAVGPAQDELYNVISTLIKQKASESGKQSDLYKLLDKREEPIALCTNLSILPAEYLNRVTDYIPSGIEPDELNLLFGFSVTKKEMTLNVGFQSDNEKVKKLMAQREKMSKKLSGSLIEKAPRNALFHAEMGIDGKKALEALKQEKSMRVILMSLNMLIDLDMIVGSIDGDLTVTVPDFDGNAVPNMLLQAELSSDKFMKNVNEWNDETLADMGISFYTKDKHNAVCTIDKMPIFFGTNDDVLSISNDESMVDNSGSRKSDLDDKVKGLYFYANLNLEKLAASFPSLDAAQRLALGNFSRLKLTAPRTDEVSFSLKFKDGVNLLDEIMQFGNK